LSLSGEEAEAVCSSLSTGFSFLEEAMAGAGCGSVPQRTGFSCRWSCQILKANTSMLSSSIGGNIVRVNINPESEIDQIPR
jgi:hypothetical protein